MQHQHTLFSCFFFSLSLSIALSPLCPLLPSLVSLSCISHSICISPLRLLVLLLAPLSYTVCCCPPSLTHSVYGLKKIAYCLWACLFIIRAARLSCSLLIGYHLCLCPIILLASASYRVTLRGFVSLSISPYLGVSLHSLWCPCCFELHDSQRPTLKIYKINSDIQPYVNFFLSLSLHWQGHKEATCQNTQIKIGLNPPRFVSSWLAQSWLNWFQAVVLATSFGRVELWPANRIFSSQCHMSRGGNIASHAMLIVSFSPCFYPWLSPISSSCVCLWMKVAWHTSTLSSSLSRPQLWTHA